MCFYPPWVFYAALFTVILQKFSNKLVTYTCVHKEPSNCGSTRQNSLYDPSTNQPGTQAPESQPKLSDPVWPQLLWSSQSIFTARRSISCAIRARRTKVRQPRQQQSSPICNTELIAGVQQQWRLNGGRTTDHQPDALQSYSTEWDLAQSWPFCLPSSARLQMANGGGGGGSQSHKSSV